ncbi:hypothetical protein NC652_028118 [Populus alba x Populus x berolinensis]|nr:hypothetical protein NC652_028118 [Populus alba x Populus x berolinensis]
MHQARSSASPFSPRATNGDFLDDSRAGASASIGTVGQRETPTQPLGSVQTFTRATSRPNLDIPVRTQMKDKEPQQVAVEKQQPYSQGPLVDPMTTEVATSETRSHSSPGSKRTILNQKQS